MQNVSLLSLNARYWSVPMNTVHMWCKQFDVQEFDINTTPGYLLQLENRKQSISAELNEYYV